MKLYGAFFLLLLVVASCSISDIRDEASAMEYLENVEKGAETLDNQFIAIVEAYDIHNEQCIENSWWKAGEKTIDIAYKNNMDISKVFSKAVSSQRYEYCPPIILRSHIQKLQNLINKNKEDYTIIAPSFQWAQGKTDVGFLLAIDEQLKMNIKLAHKWDTPATLGCSIDSVEFKPTTIHFEAKWCGKNM